VQPIATAAPEASAGIHPKWLTIMGVMEVEITPPSIPAVFMIPETVPALSRERWTAVAQNAGSAK
jgi:hypothetical protein